MSEEERMRSNMYWDHVFILLEFMINDIYPDDFRKFSPNGVIRDYFKNKYNLNVK